MSFGAITTNLAKMSRGKCLHKNECILKFFEFSQLFLMCNQWIFLFMEITNKNYTILLSGLRIVKCREASETIDKGWKFIIYLRMCHISFKNYIRGY